MRLALAFVAAMMLGCSSPEEQPTVSQGAKFEGTLDPSFVGEWATHDGGSKMSLRQDGSSRIVTHIVTGHGDPVDLSKDGKWRLSDGKLLIQNSAEEGFNVMSFTFKRPSPNRIEVQRRTPPQPIVYLRKSKP